MSKYPAPVMMARAKTTTQFRPQVAPAGPPPVAAASRRADGYVLAFLAILLLATGLRLYAVVTANFWLDEYWTMELACGRGTAHEHLPTNILLPSLPSLSSLADAKPWWTVPGTLTEVTHPPLFFLLLRGWWALLGGSDIAARLLPCVASLAALALLFYIVRRVNGPRAALWASLLMAISGQQIFYAQEVRSYSFAVALGLGALWALVEIEQRGASISRLILLAVMVLSLVLTHYFTIGLVLALAIYAAVRLPRRDLARVAIAFCAAGLAFLALWGPSMLQQRNAMGLANEGGAAFLLERGPHHVAHTLIRLIAVPAQPFAPASYMYPASIPPHLAWAGLVAFLLPLIWLRRRPDLLVWYMWAAGVVAPLVALDLTRSSMHLAFPRYTLLAGPGIFAVIGAGFERWKAPWRLVPPALVAVASVILLKDSLLQPQSKPDWQPICTIASQSMHPGDALVITAAPRQAALIYLYAAHFLGPVNRPVAMITEPASPQLLRELRACPTVWVLNAFDGPLPFFGPASQLHVVARSDVADFDQLELPR